MFVHSLDLATAFISLSVCPSVSLQVKIALGDASLIEYPSLESRLRDLGSPLPPLEHMHDRDGAHLSSMNFSIFNLVGPHVAISPQVNPEYPVYGRDAAAAQVELEPEYVRRCRGRTRERH